MRTRAPRTSRWRPTCVTALVVLATAAIAAAQPTPGGWSTSGPPNSNYGWSVARVGDVDRDGYEDLAVAAPVPNQFMSGFVRYYRGRENGPAIETQWTETLNWSSNLQSVEVAAVGDVNGDGYDDFAVGGPGLAGYAACAIYTGSASGPTHFLTIFEGNPGDGFGYSICGADVDGDGYDDVIVGQPFEGSGQIVGRVLVYRGGPAGPSSTRTWELSESNALGRFGTAVARAGDVNGDGHEDLLVGSTGLFNSGGRAQLFRGSATGPQPTSWSYTLLNSGLGDRHTLSGAGDINDDGYDDVLVGAPFNDEGRVFVFAGSGFYLLHDAPMSIVHDDLFDQRLGAAVAAAGDVNGDGYADVLIGSPGPGDGNGSAFVYLGSSSGIAPASHSGVGTASGLAHLPYWSVTGTAALGRFGDAVASLDTDGNGFREMLVGAPYADGSRGQAALFNIPAGGRIATVSVQLTSLQDPQSILQGALVPGTQGGGFFAWDTRAGDAQSGPTLARYRFQEAPYLVDLRLGSLDLRADPVFPDLTLEVENHAPGGGADRIVLRSLANRRLTSDVLVDSITLRLVDPSGTAIESEHEIQRIPVLAEWPQAFFSIGGSSLISQFSRFHADLTIAAMTPVLPPIPTGPVIALPRCYVFQAQVTTVNDPTQALQGAIAPLQVLTGQYVYNARTDDANALPTLGEYFHVASGFGIDIAAAGHTFRTNPAAVQFLVRIGNGTVQQGQLRDLYEVRSDGNLPLANGMLVDTIEWKLADPTATAIVNDSLPVNPPQLGSWPSNVLRINGRRPTTGALYEILAVTQSCIPCSQARAITSDVDGNSRGGRPLVAWVAPNPFRGTAVVRYDGVVAGSVELDVWDVAGRHVRRIVAPGTDARAIAWDGTDAQRRRVAAGIYVYRLRTPTGTARGRLVHVR